METDRGPKSVESRLAEFGKRIDALLQTAEASDLASGLRAELALWHEWIDELRLQLALGTMEGRDRIEETMTSLEQLSARVLRRLSELEDLDEPVPGMTEAVAREFEDEEDKLSSPGVFAG